MFIYYCKTLLLLDTGKVINRFGGIGRFKCRLRCKAWVNSVIINVINYMQVFFFIQAQCKNTCMYTISALYQIINLNRSTVVKAN